jgi:hypothetical protein
MCKPRVTIDGVPGEYSSIEEAMSHVPKHTGNLTVNISGEMNLRYKDMNDMQAIDAIVFEVEAGLARMSRCNAGWAMYARLTNLRKELATTRFQLQAHDERLLKASDPNTPWQGIHKECKGWMERALVAEQKLKCVEEYVEGYVKMRDAQKEGNNE